MKRLVAASATIACLINATSILAVSDEELISAPNEEQVLLEFDVYRISGNISYVGEHLEVTKAAKAGLLEGLMSFTRAKLTVAGVELCADEGGWTWLGKDRPPEGSRIETIASPKVLVLFGQSFVVDVGSQQPIEYFEKRPDGLFELKKFHQKTGFSVSGRAERQGGEQIILRDLTMRLQSVERREPIQDVALDVGRPVVNRHECVTTMAVRAGGYYGMLFGREAYGSLLLRLRVIPVHPRETLNPSSTAQASNGLSQEASDDLLASPASLEGPAESCPGRLFTVWQALESSPWPLRPFRNRV